NATFTYTDSTTGCFETSSTINVKEAPQITVQPTATQTVCSGSSASISVTATGAGLSYQWYKGSTPLTNGGNFFGTNSATLTINPIDLSDASTDYYCLISGDCSPSVTSDSASLIVNEAISIITQPIATQTYCNGSNVSISTSASGTGLTYQWFRGLNPLTDGGSISGANTNTLTINTASVSDSGNDYYCIVSGLAPCNSVNSNFSEIIITENPSFTNQPVASQTVCAGSNVTFSVAASGGSLTYQWYNDTTPLTDNATVSGSNSATLTLSNISLADVSTKYNCHVTNSCGAIISNYSALSINETPSILNNNLTVCSGESFSFTPANGVPSSLNVVPSGTTYSWSAPVVTGGMTGGTAQSGQTVISDVFVNNTNSVQTAIYTITPIVGTCPGNTFELVINVNPEPYVNNAIFYVCSGENINFLPTDGNGNIVPVGSTFSWGLPSTSGGITGANAQINAASFNQTLINTTNGVQTATYNIAVNYGTCVGNTFTVTFFINPKPIVSAAPITQTICSGENITDVTLSTVFVVSEEVEFHWTRDNTTNVTGMPSEYDDDTIYGSLTNHTNTPQTTTFSVIATTEEGCNSDPYLVTVLVNPTIVVSATPSNQTVCSGNAINPIILSNPNNVSGVTYSWSRSNTLNLTGIPDNGTGNTISGSITNNNNTVQTTTISIIASANGCQSVVSNITITVSPKPTVTGSPSTQTLCGSNTITPIVLSSASGISGTTYSWTRDNAVTVTGISGSGTGTSISGVLNNNTSSNQTVTFTLTASANGCASDNTTTEVIVLPRPLLAATPSTQTICNNTAISPINLSSANNLPGTSFSWTRNNTTNLTGISSSGSGNSITGVLVNTTAVSQTTTFTITVTAGNGCSNTTTVTVTVYAPLTAPVISASQTVCEFSTPAALTLSTTPTGGSGVYTYQWQSSPDNVNFTNIAGATNSTYQPPFLNNGANDVFYKLIVNNTCGSVTSNEVFVEVVSNIGFTFGLNNVPTTALCPATSFTPQISSLHLSTSSVRFNWTADPNFILPSSGGPVGTTGAAIFIFRTSTGNIGPLTAQNNTNATVTTQITITPSVYNFPGPPSGAFLCSTSPQILNVTIRPRPVASAVALENTICNGSGANIQVTGNITDANMTFSWTRNNTTNVTGTNSGTSGNIAPGSIFTIANALTNNSANVQNVTFTITPSSNGCTGSPVTVTISIAPTVTSGTIAANQTICSGGDPVAFTQAVAATGSNLTYQWQSSTDNITFTNITGATSVTYDAGTLTQTTWFRRITISTVNGKECYATSNTIQVNVNSINPGSISGNQTICFGGDPLAFTEVNATGGGTISYQWQSNTTGCSGSWTNIAGANSATYDAPSGVTATTYYRRMATSLLNSVACSDYSNCIAVTVNEVTGGVIADNQTLCGNNPAAFSVIAPSTGSGTLTYQWQRSTTGCSGPWTTISGATGATYDAPSGLVATTYYQRITISTLNGVQCSAESNCVTVTVNPVTGGA
uniref:beta strand repeat-containing protein n=1 Tax=Flavobacterium sp. TaxID=239 RepID=UPI0037C0B3B5